VWCPGGGLESKAMPIRARWSALSAWMRGDGGASRLAARMFWVALAVRVLYMTVAHTYRLRIIIDHFEFGWEMGRIARALATGYGFADPFNGHSGPTAWTAPLYPLLLAGVFKVFGVYTLKSAWVILAINSVFSAGVAPAVYEMAWRCFGLGERGLKIALWSGWLWALYPAAMQYAVRWVWEMSLTAFLFAWVIVLALRIRGLGEEAGGSSQRAGRWVGFGILWGLIGLSNSSLLAFLPACVLWMTWEALRTGRGLGLAVRNGLLAAVCCAAVFSPWVARNFHAFHRFVPLRANFGAELYASVRPGSNGFPWGATLPMAEASPDFQRYERVGEVVYSQRQGERAKAILRAHRLRFAGYTLQRVYFFWFGVPHTVERSVLVEAGREANYAFVSLGALLGLALALRERIPCAWLFFWMFATVPVAYYALTVQARFRHPLEPVMTVLIVFLFQSAERPGARTRRMLEGMA
jgi:hypothetical protein